MIPHPKGAHAETKSLRFLAQQGLTLEAQNWHCPWGEIDLIMRDGDTLVFVEVKQRKNAQFGGAMFSISPAKCAKWWRSAEFYLQNFYPDAPPPCRFDAVLWQGNSPPLWLKDVLQG